MGPSVRHRRRSDASHRAPPLGGPGSRGRRVDGRRRGRRGAGHLRRRTGGAGDRLPAAHRAPSGGGTVVVAGVPGAVRHRPGLEAIAAAADLERDRTPVALAGDLPGGTVAIVGWPDQADYGAADPEPDGRRGGSRTAGADNVLVVSSGHDGWGCADWLSRTASTPASCRRGRRPPPDAGACWRSWRRPPWGPTGSWPPPAPPPWPPPPGRRSGLSGWSAGVGGCCPPRCTTLWSAGWARTPPGRRCRSSQSTRSWDPPARPSRCRLPRSACPVAAELLRFSG